MQKDDKDTIAMTEYKIRFCEYRDFDDVLRMNKQSNLFATAQFLTGPSSIEKTMKSSKFIFLVAEHIPTSISQLGENPRSCYGYILAKMQAPGVCFNLLLTVDKPHRRRGVGGGLIIALLKLLSVKNTPWESFTWWCDVPSYNVEALQMYKALHFDVEGCRRKTTRAKTDMYQIAFHLDEKPIPEYGRHVSNPAIIVDDSLVVEFKQRLENSKSGGFLPHAFRTPSDTTPLSAYWSEKAE